MREVIQKRKTIKLKDIPSYPNQRSIFDRITRHVESPSMIKTLIPLGGSIALLPDSTEISFSPFMRADSLRQLYKQNLLYS